jgi:hypothetical protein
MRLPAVAALLDAWEQGLPRPQLERTLGLLAAAWPGATRDDLADLSIGAYDGALLRLREQAFGPRLQARTSCSACGEALDMELSVSDILVEPAVGAAATFTVAHDGYEIELRLPSNRDLIYLRDHPASDARRALFERCLVRVRRDGIELDAGQGALPESLPDGVLESAIAMAAEQMAAADPQADIRLNLSCAVCGHGWQAGFDIGAFFWTEVDAWARRVLGEVHALALAYGWSQADILALSAWRRQYYLDMVAGG